MDLIDTLVSLCLQVSTLLGIAAYIWIVKHPRLRQHPFRRWINVAATLGLLLFIGPSLGWRAERRRLSATLPGS